MYLSTCVETSVHRIYQNQKAQTWTKENIWCQEETMNLQATIFKIPSPRQNVVPYLGTQPHMSPPITD